MGSKPQVAASVNSRSSSPDDVPRRFSGGSSRREFVAEGAARRALHDRPVAREADLAAARRGNVEIGLADKQCTELGLAERAKELGEAAPRDVEFQRLLVVTTHRHGDIL